MAFEAQERAIELVRDTMAPLREPFIAAMRLVPTAVSVITTDGPAGRFGVTVSALASVSADPPMLLTCINFRSPACAAIRGNGVFTVNLLSEAQSHVADCFAGRATSGDHPAFDFGCASWTSDIACSAPRLEDAVAAFHCEVDHAHRAATHMVFIGRVIAARSTGAPALAYVAQDYARISKLSETALNVRN
ncbi:flavin reductase family protein [Acidiphilium sp. AL]|uniref:Flavin reductase family protein n=1 Tax=Acidiphilium iwatense TaxID=768198 RepID=A0ABS9E475_9PROT|nr:MULTISPECIES: flavin reductase family protein [Acidiphilium]MCF3948716.1 flavin reductase family protein [Acidiphilium iwatense]MCU4160375.1 flavin reductase family protein [Acidiphilium sp. AL]